MLRENLGLYVNLCMKIFKKKKRNKNESTENTVQNCWHKLLFLIIVYISHYDFYYSQKIVACACTYKQTSKIKMFFSCDIYFIPENIFT